MPGQFFMWNGYVAYSLNDARPNCLDRFGKHWRRAQWDALSDEDREIIGFCRRLQPTFRRQSEAFMDYPGAGELRSHWSRRLLEASRLDLPYPASDSESQVLLGGLYEVHEELPRSPSKKGSLIEQIDKWLEDFKRMEAAKAKKSRMSDPARALLEETAEEDLIVNEAFEIDEDD